MPRRKETIPITAIFDERERTVIPEIMKYLNILAKKFNKPGVPYIRLEYKVEQLGEGDYLFKYTYKEKEHKVLIERKSLEDFLKSVYDHRLDKQLFKMMKALQNKEYNACSLCIIGNPFTTIDGRSRHKDLLFGKKEINTLISKMAKSNKTYKIPSHLAFNNEWFAKYCLTFAVYDELVPVKETIVREIPKELKETAKILMGIDGIGQEIAIALADRFSSITKLCNATIEEIMEVTAPRSIESGQQSRIDKNKKTAQLIYNKLRGRDYSTDIWKI